MKTLILTTLFVAAAFAQLATERETAVGKAVAGRMGKALDDDAVNLLVNRVVERLSRGVVLRLPLQLKLIESEEATASALPGGILVFSSAAISRAGSESELAAEIAHGIAHVQEPLSGPVFFLSCGRDSTNLLPMRLSPIIADGENKADLLAAGYLAEAGYEPEALLTLYDRTQTRFVPSAETRRVVGGRSMAMTDSVLDTHEFQEIKARLTTAKPIRRTPTLYR